MKKFKNYLLGDYKLNIIGQTFLLVRMDTFRRVDFRFGHGCSYGEEVKVTLRPEHISVTTCSLRAATECRNAHDVAVPGGLLGCRGHAELWFQWNHEGVLSTGKGWILGQDTLVQYDGEKPLPVFTVALMTTDENGINIEVHRDKKYPAVDDRQRPVGACAVGKTQVELSVTKDISLYVISDYGVPIIGRESVTFVFIAPQKLWFLFSQHYDIDKDDIRRIFLLLTRSVIWAGVKYCTPERSNAKDENCASSFKEKAEVSADSRNDVLNVWVTWTQEGYVALGKGRSPGQDTVVEYTGASTRHVNYVTLSLPQETNITVYVSSCKTTHNENKHH